MAQTQTCACCGSEGEGETEGSDSMGMTCYCPLDGVINTVGKKYSMQIVALLGANGPMRYSELESQLEVTSTSTLAERLDQMEEADLVDRRSFDEVPPRVEYSLTGKGRELEERVQPLLEWAAQVEE